jgi:hypothetical protein
MMGRRLRHAVATAVRCGGRVGAARTIRAEDRRADELDPDQRARRARIRSSLDGILRCVGDRYGFDLNDGTIPTWGAHKPRDVG